MSESKKLVRSQESGVIAGVCSGLARYFEVDPVLVRLVFIALAFVNGLGVLGYLILWLIVPDESHRELEGEEVVRANVSDIGQRARQLGSRIREAPQGSAVVGILLVALGAMFLIHQFLPGVTAGLIWPVALIVIGAYLLFTRA